MNKNKILSGGGKNLIGGGKWGRRGREVGEKGEGSGGKGGGNWEWGTPLSTPSILHARTQEISSGDPGGGGGGPGPSATSFFSHQLNLRLFFKENYNFPRLQRGFNIFGVGGGQTLPGGGGGGP